MPPMVDSRRVFGSPAKPKVDMDETLFSYAVCIEFCVTPYKSNMNPKVAITIEQARIPSKLTGM